MIFSPFTIVRRHLYLLQLENYDLGRSLTAIRNTRGARLRAPRKPISWTQKLATVFALALIIQSVIAFAIAAIIPLPSLGRLAVFLAAEYILSFVHFVFLFAATAAVSPLDRVLKRRIISSAKKKISLLPRLRVLGIVGSYGKTTMKEVLAAVLGEKFKIVKTPENINTPVGISRHIMRVITPETQVFIAEMGAYERGDIKTLCEIARPDISVLTGINESHLERFGSMHHTITAKFEIIEYAKPNGIAVLNADNPLIVKHFQEHVGRRTTIFYSSENRLGSEFQAGSIRLLENGSGTAFELFRRARSLGSVRVPFLGSYIIGTILAAAAIAAEFGLDEYEIVRGIASLKPIPHRLEPIKSAGGALIIDDSYNGNPDGAREAIEVLMRFSGRRKIYVTPGLAEMGPAAGSVHKKIGGLLARAADVVILIRNSVTPFIAEGLEEHGFKKENILWFNDAREAHDAVPKMLQPRDVVLFQNDWPDNYL